MGKTSTQHALYPKKDIREQGALSFRVSRGNPNGNRESRLRKTAGANLHHTKGGDDWRKNAWLCGMRWPQPRTSSVVDRSAVVVRGKNKRCPIAVTALAKEKRAERERVRTDPRHTLKLAKPVEVKPEALLDF